MSGLAAVLALLGAEVSQVATAGDTLRMRLAAAAVRRGAEDGFLLDVSLCFGAARWQGQPGACIGSLAQGEVRHAGERLLRLPLDFTASGPVTAEFLFDNGEHLHVSAGTLSVQVPGGARWVASLAC